MLLNTSICTIIILSAIGFVKQVKLAKKLNYSFKNNKLLLRVVYDCSCNVRWQSMPCGSR